MHFKCGYYPKVLQLYRRHENTVSFAGGKSTHKLLYRINYRLYLVYHLLIRSIIKNNRHGNLFHQSPFKAEFGKFSRESRSPAITKSGALYYPLWLIYAALYSEKNGHKIHFLDAPAKQLNEEQSLEIIQRNENEHSLFVLDTSTPSIKVMWILQRK